MHGSYYTASVSRLHILSKTLQRLSLSTNPVCPHEHNFTRSLGANSDSDQCGQIFGFGTKNEIQNHGHTYKNTDSSGCFYPLHHQRFNVVAVQISHCRSLDCCNIIVVPFDSKFLLLENLSNLTQPPNSSSKACLPATRTEIPIEYGLVQ